MIFTMFDVIFRIQTGTMESCIISEEDLLVDLGILSQLTSIVSADWYLSFKIIWEMGSKQVSISI